MEFEEIKKYFSTIEFGSATNGLLITIGCLVFVKLLQKTVKWLTILRKGPPGPVGLPIVGYLPFLGKEPHKTLRKMKEKYGDVISVYLGPKYTVVLNEYTVVKEVLGHPYALDRSQELFASLGSLGFGTENGEKWHEQRKFVLQAARDLGLGKGPWEELIMEEASTFIEEVKKIKGKPVNITPTLVSSLNASIISLLIGRRLNKDEEADKIELCMDYAHEALKNVAPSNPTSLVPGLRKLFEILKIAGFDRAAKTIQNFNLFM
ncbi:cytochrome P450 18a1, partial [Trichonephila clavata]